MSRGGKSITQAKPTNFHVFYTRKILTQGESVSDFREVTAQQRKNIEKNDAEWVRPPQAFIDAWNAATSYIPRPEMKRIGIYNENTGYFELNGLLDITYAQAIPILEAYRGMGGTSYCNYASHRMLVYGSMRTTIPPAPTDGVERLHDSFCSLSSIEVVRLFRYAGNYQSLFLSGSNIFSRATVRKWVDIIYWFGGPAQGNSNANTFGFDSFGWTDRLEYFRFQNVNFNINCRYYPNLGLDTLQYVVDHRYPVTTSGANPITITVHSDVYAKLTGDMTNAAASALTPDELAGWTDLLAKAAEMQVIFATV